MKRILLTIVLLSAGMAVFAQDLSYFTNEFINPDRRYDERLNTLETMQAVGVKATGEVYHEYLSYLLRTLPEVLTRSEQEAVEKSVVILCEGLGSEKHTAAAYDLWRTAERFDAVRGANEGLAMQSALIAIGDVDGKEYLPNIAQRLADYNTQTYRNAETRRKVQVAVIGCIRALETFKDISGYRPVFFAYAGSWDPMIKEMAADALPKITTDPADVIIEIIRDPSVTPTVKLVAWSEMLKTNAPNASKAKVAAAALDTGWIYSTSNRTFQTNLRDLRMGAIDIIRRHGIEGDNVYINLEKSYSNNFISNSPEFDEIRGVLDALAEIKSDEAVALLLKFLRELDGRRRSGPWRDKERQLFDWVVSRIGMTGTRNQEVRILLMTIQRNNSYVPAEQRMAASALSALGN